MWFVRSFLFTVLAYATLRYGLKRRKILVRTVGRITGAFNHMELSVPLCQKAGPELQPLKCTSTVPLSDQWALVRQMLQEHYRTITYYWKLITKYFLLSDYTITIFNCTNNCTNTSVTANRTHRLSSGKIMVKGIQTQGTF